MHDARTPEESLVVGGIGGGRVNRGDVGHARVVQGCDRRWVAGEAEGSLGVGGDEVHAVAQRLAGHRRHENAHELVGAGDEGGVELTAERREAMLEIGSRGRVGGVEGQQCLHRRAGRGLSLAGRHPLTEKVARSRSARSGRERLEPDVLVEHDKVGAVSREQRCDLDPHRAIDRAGIARRSSS